ncbi:MAG TPA: hypothetical protein VLB89_04625 [Gaiellaceae bacterium]|nr:hypothetical protein [Gaiellaceae bacterium]
MLVLSVFAFAGAASAGNGNGNGNQGDAPGNSASAPGQMKKDEAAPPVAPSTTTTPPAPPTTTSAENATGVKPSSETVHETDAEARSDKTKQYGNGQTAGQIAEHNGAAGTDVLHGPGNSQPHKVTPCPGGHEPDVHALTSHRHGGSCGGPEPSPTPEPHPHPQPNLGPPVAPPTTVTTITTQQTPPKDPGSKPASGDAPGAVASSGADDIQSKGALVSAQHVATLPFTGARLWILVLAGLIMIAAGLALREIRTAQASVESGHDHTDRTRHAARGSGAPFGGGPGR